MVSKVFNVGVIGFGLSAKTFHIPFINAVPGLNLYAIVHKDANARNDAQKMYPGVKTFDTVADMLKESSLDLVILATPPDTHFELAKQALEAGKNVVVEKPFTPTHKEAEELIAIAKKNNLLLSVYQNRRWDSDYATLEHLIKTNALGRVVDYESHFDRHRPEPPAANSTWKIKVIPGGSAIYDLGAHLIDQIYHLFGAPKKITGFITTQRAFNPTGYEDSFNVRLEYENGLVATAKSNCISPEERQLRFWVRGEKGSYKKFHLDVQEEQLRAGMLPTDPSYGIEPEDRHGVLTSCEDGKITGSVYPTINPPPNFTSFYAGIAKALAGEAEVPVKPEDASAVIRLIELAQQSSKEGRTLSACATAQ
ncbi:hypothetical protein KEM56_005632 [Ascosphaera pollenicola]|nr:hypothetical protein KEM56_005632 [Ascosphaera pollenicola]